MTAKQTEDLMTKNKNQADSISHLVASVKALTTERATLIEAINLMKKESRDNDPGLHKDLESRNNEVADLTDENNSLRNQIRTLEAKLHSIETQPVIPNSLDF